MHKGTHEFLASNINCQTAYCRETVAISKRKFGNESYQYRYSVWIEEWLMQGL